LEELGRRMDRKLVAEAEKTLLARDQNASAKCDGHSGRARG
jgi:hypothetical protein